MLSLHLGCAAWSRLWGSGSALCRRRGAVLLLCSGGAHHIPASIMAPATWTEGGPRSHAHANETWARRNCPRTPATPRKHTRHAARHPALTGLPGRHPVWPWRLADHIHLVAQGHSEGAATHCQQAHGVVSARMVLPHGSHG